MKHPFQAQPSLALNQSRHRRPAQGARPARKRFAGVILAGCIATLLAPQLHADTVTGRNGSTNPSNYTTTRSNSLFIGTSNNPGFTMTGGISGAGSVTISGTGTVTWAGSTANTYTKQTIITGGTLVLNKTPGVNAIVGDGISSVTTPDVVITGGELRLGTDNQMDDSVYVQVGTGGTFNLNGKTDTIYNLNNLGGTVVTGRGGMLHLIDPTWNAGSVNTVSGQSTYDVIAQDTTAPNNILVIAGGGTNVVHGSETYGVGANGVNNGYLLIGGPLQITGADGSGKILTVNADHDQGGFVRLAGDVSATFGSGTATIANGPALTSNGVTADLVQTSLVNGQVDLNGAQRNFTVTNAAATLSIAPTVTNGGITKEGAGKLVLTGNNTFTGATTVNAGTLVAAGADMPLTGGGTQTNKALGATSAITVNSTGTLIMNTANQASAAANVTLNGGTLNLAGVSQGSAGTAGLGMLILQAESTLDFGTTGTANSITFGGVGSHTAGTKLNITDYEAGSDHLFFSGDMSSFTNFFTMNDVSFNGSLGYHATQGIGFFEIDAGIVPVPEPATIVGAAGLLGLVGYRERKRVRGVWTSRIVPGLSFLGFLLFGGLAAVGKAVGLRGRRF